jgi:hypothetical protein
MNTDYQKQGRDFLAKHNITFKATFKGDKCPMWDDVNHIHGDRYIATFKRGKRSFSLSFWNSLKDKEEGNTPTAYDVLTCIQKYDPGTFENFCGDFGYDEDSRKAEKTYKAVVKEWWRVYRFFTSSEIEEMQEIQ